MNEVIRPTFHAICRQAQRNLSDQDIDFVYAHGRRIHCAGALHIFLAKRDIPRDTLIARRFSHLEGTTLVMNGTLDGAVLITAYRNRRALKQIRAKAKFNRQRRHSAIR